MIGTHLGESGQQRNNNRVLEKRRRVGAEKQKNGWKRGEFWEKST